MGISTLGMPQPTSPLNPRSPCTLSCKRNIKFPSTYKHVTSTSVLLNQQTWTWFKHKPKRADTGQTSWPANTPSATTLHWLHLHCCIFSAPCLTECTDVWSALCAGRPELPRRPALLFKWCGLSKLGFPCKSKARNCVQTGQMGFFRC